MARMTSMDIESSPPSFEFNFELPSPYAAISEQTQKSLPWDAKQEPRAGREDNSRADITKDTIKSSETSSTPSAGRDSATGKRKRSNHAQHTRDGAGNKKRKTIGRPKNDWTPSRQRKLIRLYLMTDLTVEEIIRVLRRRGFAPSMRDVQDQLKDLLQRRPNTIRGRTILPKVRLRIVRECRALQLVTESHPPQRAKETQKPSASSQEETVSAFAEYGPLITEWPWQVDQVLDSYGFGLVAQQEMMPESAGYGQPTTEWPCQVDEVLDAYGFGLVGQQEDREVGLFKLANSERREGIHPDSSEHLLGAESDNLGLGNMLQDTEVLEESVLSTSDVPSVESDRDLSCSSVSLSQSPSQVLHQREPNSEKTATPGLTSSDFSSVQPPPQYSSPANEAPALRPISCQSSIHSVGGLQRRLGKKTNSCLEDVWSVMQNLTISGSSMHRDSASSCKSSTVSTVTLTRSKQRFSSLGDIDENEQYNPSVSDQGQLPLPGDVAGGDIASPLFDHVIAGHATSNSNRLALLEYRVDHATFVSNINDNLCWAPYENVNDADDFGNTILHITAALGKPPAYLFALVHKGTDVNATNRAGQTFLHLLDQSVVKDTDPFHTLLSMLLEKAFDFSKSDCLGRTPLHPLLPPGMDESCVDATLAQLSFLRITLPTSRDSFGRTIMSQLKEAGIPEARIQSLFPSTLKMPAFPNYGARTAIETVADLLIYEKQADLVKTIRRAWSYPQYEDHAGRNGLHCLAEVSFTLPLPDTLPTDNKQTGNSRRREELLALLEAGVDVNAYDKQGATPLMSFIIHNRDDENGVAFHTLLSMLCNAGASLNRRDRQGRSPLHLAVMLGKKTATNLLLRQGANVHARDINGLGVISLGLKHSKIAKRFSTLYGQIMLCVSLVADSGGVSAPTFLHEWTSNKTNIQETKESRWALLPRRSIRRRDPFHNPF